MTAQFPAQHPYLALTPADSARAKERAAQFPWAKKALEKVADDARGAVAKPLGKLPEKGDTEHWSIANRLQSVALAYGLTGETQHAEWVRDGLLAYADVYPTMSLTNGRCKVFTQSSLYEAMWVEPIAQAYDLVADSGVLTDEQKAHIEADLLRPTVACFKIDDFENDPRIRDLHYRCYNFQAWHLGAVGLVGLALRDPELVDYAVNSPYGFRHLVAHDIREDGLFWERSVGYHHFVLNALLPFTEAMLHCGVDLYHFTVPNDRAKDEDCHCVTDVTDQPKSLRLMFEAPFYLGFPDLSYLALGDSDRGPLHATWMDLIGYDRYRDPKLAWLLQRDVPLSAEETRSGRVGFLHYYRYRYRYDQVRLNGQPVKWERRDPTFELQGDAITVDDGGASQSDHYLLSDADLTDLTLEWTMTRLADSGGNFIRFRMDSWWNAIEGPPDAVAGYLGPGWYQQETSWEIDRVYELAEQRGIRIMHCVDNANANVNIQRDDWRRPFNYLLKELGGPCATVDDFWTNPEATRLFRNRLRYTAARWGYSASAFCWEFWNEYACRTSNIDAASNWHAQMARYLRGIDPYAHPITTSLMGDASLYDRIFSLPEMEIIQVHTYAQTDLAEAQETLLAEMTARYRKPFFIGESGIATGHGEGRYEWDADGLHLHNGLWAPTFAGAAGAGAFWYVEPSVDARDLYYVHQPLADFTQDLRWNSADLGPAQVSVPAFETLPAELHFTDFVVPTATKFAFEKPPVTTFDLRPDAPLDNAGMIRPYLHCSEGRKAPPTFRVHFGKPGAFVVHVTESVGNDQNKLQVYVDGNQAVEQSFPAGKGLGKNSSHIAQYDNWKTTYDEQVVVPVSAGDHEIRPEATGKDRLEVGYSLTNYQCFEKSAPLRVTGVATKESAFLWLQNRLSNWTTLWDKRELLPVPAGMTATVSGLADGAYRIEWWDTRKGGVTATQQGQCRGGQLRLELPRVERDVACRVLRQGAGG